MLPTSLFAAHPRWWHLFVTASPHRSSIACQERTRIAVHPLFKLDEYLKKLLNLHTVAIEFSRGALTINASLLFLCSIQPGINSLLLKYEQTADPCVWIFGETYGQPAGSLDPDFPVSWAQKYQTPAKHHRWQQWPTISLPTASPANCGPPWCLPSSADSQNWWVTVLGALTLCGNYEVQNITLELYVFKYLEHVEVRRYRLTTPILSGPTLLHHLNCYMNMPTELDVLRA